MTTLTLIPGGRLAWLRHPPLLLLLSGVLVGVGFPLSKVAASAGIPALSWVALHALGVMLALGPLLWRQRRLHLPRGGEWRYTLVAGPATFAAPNLIAFAVIPHAGAGYTGIMYALSPVITLALAVMLRMQSVSRWGLVGITLGLLGAMLVSLGRGLSVQDVEGVWLLSAAVIPFVLASGNIFRTRAWPSGASPDRLAFWSNGFAFVAYLILALVLTSAQDWQALAGFPWLVAGQLLLSGLTAPVVFRLQKHGGPVMLSQIGYVAAATGLAIATVFLGEQYSLTTWQGAGLIALGIAATVYAAVRRY